jgi:hypothetical protein
LRTVPAGRRRADTLDQTARDRPQAAADRRCISICARFQLQIALLGIAGKIIGQCPVNITQMRMILSGSRHFFAALILHYFSNSSVR